jgi:hypothetical protein
MIKNPYQGMVVARNSVDLAKAGNKIVLGRKVVESEDAGDDIRLRRKQPTEFPHVAANKTDPVLKTGLSQMPTTKVNHRLRKVETNESEVGAASSEVS